MNLLIVSLIKVTNDVTYFKIFSKVAGQNIKKEPILIKVSKVLDLSKKLFSFSEQNTFTLIINNKNSKVTSMNYQMSNLQIQKRRQIYNKPIFFFEEIVLPFDSKPLLPITCIIRLFSTTYRVFI
jgi:hypothetical protein